MCWHSHMLVMMEAYEKKVPYRATFCSPDKSITLEQWLVGFVDDNTIVFTLKDLSFNIDNVTNLFSMADECLATWQKLVVITGGDIELDKSAVSVLAWEKQ